MLYLKGSNWEYCHNQDNVTTRSDIGTIILTPLGKTQRFELQKNEGTKKTVWRPEASPSVVVVLIGQAGKGVSNINQ
jgi:hypothetical protein